MAGGSSQAQIRATGYTPYSTELVVLPYGMICNKDMRKRYTLILLVLLAAVAAPAGAAQSPPFSNWVSANEYYLILPAPQDIYFQGNKETAVAYPWGFGFRALGNGRELLSKTGAVQVQIGKVSGHGLPEAKSLYVTDMLLGLDYMTLKVKGRPLRFTASALGDFGLANTEFFMAPVISAGLLYTTDESAETPAGLAFNVFYRLININLGDLGGGKSGTLRPALGFKIGYIFEGFWSTRSVK